jgi:hypothetical protein
MKQGAPLIAGIQRRVSRRIRLRVSVVPYPLHIDPMRQGRSAGTLGDPRGLGVAISLECSSARAQLGDQ